MDFQKWAEETRTEFKSDPDYIIEGILFDIGEMISKSLTKNNWSRKTLAQKLGVSQPYITKILKGNSNLTIKSLVNISMALGNKISINFEEFENNIQFKSHEEYGQSYEFQTFLQKGNLTEGNKNDKELIHAA